MTPAKIVVWAHNSHVGDAGATQRDMRGETNLGQLCRERHPRDTVLIGFSTYTGTVTTRETLVTIPANGFYAQRWSFGEHTATHLDAPGHFVLGGRFTPELTPEELMLPIAVIDISRRAASNPDADISG